MRVPKTTFNSWVLTKILNYLATSEGCCTENLEYTTEGMKSIIRDSFGYRYEINIRTLSRIDDASRNTDFLRKQV